MRYRRRRPKPLSCRRVDLAVSMIIGVLRLRRLQPLANRQAIRQKHDVQ